MPLFRRKRHSLSPGPPAAVSCEGAPRRYYGGSHPPPPVPYGRRHPPPPAPYGGPHPPSPGRPPPHAGLSPPGSRQFSWDQRHRRSRGVPHQFGMQAPPGYPSHAVLPSGCRPSSAATSSGRAAHHSHGANRGFGPYVQAGPGARRSGARPCSGPRAGRGSESACHPGARRSHSTGPGARGAFPDSQFTRYHTSVRQPQSSGTRDRGRPDTRDTPYPHCGSAYRSPSTGGDSPRGTRGPSGRPLPHAYGSPHRGSGRFPSPPTSPRPPRPGECCPPWSMAEPNTGPTGMPNALRRQRSPERCPPFGERRHPGCPAAYSQARDHCSARHAPGRTRGRASVPLPTTRVVRPPDGVTYPESGSPEREHLPARRAYYRNDASSVKAASNGLASPSRQHQQTKHRSDQGFFSQPFRECCEAQSIEAPRVDRYESGETHFHFYQPRAPPLSNTDLASQSAVAPQQHFNFFTSPSPDVYRSGSLAGSETVNATAQALGHNPVVSSLLQENLYYQQLIAEQQEQLGAMAAAQQAAGGWYGHVGPYSQAASDLTGWYNGTGAWWQPADALGEQWC